MATQPSAAAEQVFRIPLPDIQISKHNPRRHIEQGALNDLAADIANRGVQEPVLLRPIQGPRKFELVFGERRYHASQKAKKADIPALVRAMSDEEAQELRVIENLQREDLHPLDWASALELFYKKRYKESRSHDDAVAFVSGKFRKPSEIVARLLSLNELIESVKSAFRDGKMEVEHAYELARLRQEEQKQVLDWMLSQHKEVKTESGWRKHSLMPGVPELKLWIRQNLFLDLSKAPFDPADPKLNAKMGACSHCPFRTGSQAALFGDVKSGDVCTVPSCWVSKRNAAIVLQTAALAKELGVKSVLKIGLGYASWNHAKIPVDAYVEYNSEARIVKKGTECQHTQPGCITWIANQGDAGSLKVGDTVQVCTKAQTCSVHSKVDSRSRQARKSYEEMADTRVSNLKKDTPQHVRAALIRGVIEAAQKQRHPLSAADRIKFDLIADQMHSDLYFDRHRDLCKLMGVEPIVDKHGQGKDWRGTSEQLFENDPLSMMIAMVLMHHYHAGSYRVSSDPLPQLLRVCKVKAQAIELQVKAEISQKIETIQAALKRRKSKQSAQASAHRKSPAKSAQAKSKA